MMIKIKIVLVLISILLALMVPFLMNGYPFIINGNKKEVAESINFALSGFNPLERMELSGNGNCAYLVFSRQDQKELPEGMKKAKVFVCKDNVLLNELKNKFSFKKSDGDIASCEGKIYIYSHGKLVFHTGFVLNDNMIGLQSQTFGWAEAINKAELKSLFTKFDPVMSPILIL